MNFSLGRFRLRVAAGLLSLAALAPANALGQLGLGHIPTINYFKTFGFYYDGEYKEALNGFQAEGRSAIKSADSRWVDSICYHTMVGECYYQMGQYENALEQYNSALTIYLAYPSWMLRVDFPPLIPASNNELPLIPWGVRKRISRVAKFRDTMMMSQGQIDNSGVLVRGGAVQAPVQFPVNVAEIVRCTTQAMRRRHEIMGPMCKYDPLTTKLVDALARRPAPHNSWSQAWIDVELGVAYASAESPQAAHLLEHGLVAGEGYDHPLTSIALVELGRLALESGNVVAAAQFFDEATYSAVYFPDIGILEEAFRYRQLAHLMSNAKGIYRPLLIAADWAKAKGYRQLNASLLSLAAENMAVAGDNAKAAALVADARTSVGTRPMAAGCLGARLNHVAALVAYQANDVATGDRAINAALAFQRMGSLWMFQIGLADAAARAGTLSERNAMTIYALLLRDPTPADWLTSPLESLSVLATPHLGAYEHWLDFAFKRGREQELALEISDRLKRHRFYSTLPLGGRLLALRWILEGPKDLLSQRAVLQRQDLLVHYPQYQQLAKQAQTLREKLAASPPVAEAADAKREQSGDLDALSAIGVQQEHILRAIALRHEPADLVFPPLRSAQQIQKSLPQGHVLLVFAATSNEIHAFMFSSQKYKVWTVGNLQTVQKQMSTLLREMGNTDQAHEMSLAELNQTSWKKTSAKIWDLLFDKSNIDLSFKFEEMAIVPDGFLWYLPFEALQVGKKGSETSLLSRVRVRYAPTVGLAIPYPRVQKPNPAIGVVVGRLHPKDDESIARDAFGEMARAIPGAVALPSTLPAPASVYRSLFDELIVLDDIKPGEGGPYGWAPASTDRNKHASALATWFALPWGGPENLILPGFHTPAESALKKNAVGNDLFLSVCGIMSTGVRTVLISRWRTAGQTSFDLVREFVLQLPHASAADAWQRSVQVLNSMPLNFGSEPRIKKVTAETQPPKTEHPIFWAGYMVIDSGVASEVAEIEEEKPILDFRKKLPAGGKAPVANGAAKAAAAVVGNGADAPAKIPAVEAVEDDPPADEAAAKIPADDDTTPPPKPATPKSKKSSSPKVPAKAANSDG